MRWQDIENEKEKYAAYLCSREWAEKKEAVHARANGRCERCMIGPIDAVHHLTYARKYREELGDLQAICTPCHEFTHGKSDCDPRRNPLRIEFNTDCVMICPICGHDHIETTSVSPELSPDSPVPVSSVKCWCEYGHSFYLCFFNYKGHSVAFGIFPKTELRGEG